MATKMPPKGALALAAEEPDEASQGELPDDEMTEGAAQPPDAPAAPDGGPMGEGDGPGIGAGGKEPIDPRLIELSNLVVSRVRQAMAANGSELASALKADPVQAAVEIGTGAVREVAKAASEAGKPIPFEVLLVAGMQALKDLAALASELGYLPDEQIESFLKEGFQQSVAAYAQMDMADGLIDEQALQSVQQKVGAAGAQGMAGGGALAQAAGEGG